MKLCINLPWPPKNLSPNARVHWSKKAKAAKVYRNECAWQAKVAIKAGDQAQPFENAKERLHLWLDFYPPDRRNRDDDNLIAAFKSGRDGIADALGVDDKRFVCHPFVKDEIGGFIRARITTGPNE